MSLTQQELESEMKTLEHKLLDLFERLFVLTEDEFKLFDKLDARYEKLRRIWAKKQVEKIRQQEEYDLKTTNYIRARQTAYMREQTA